MAELSTIARPYAAALFEIARTSGESLDKWLAAAEDMASLASHPQVAEVVADPKLDDAQVFELLSGMSRTSLTPAGINFLKLVIANQRIAVLPEVAAQFRKLKNDAEGVAECVIESAFPLDEADVRDLLATLGKRVGRKLKPTVEINPELIGGVRVVVGDRVLDGSVRAQLNQMQAALTA
jgi:F-type H+-transporting ATPase subunit delta